MINRFNFHSEAEGRTIHCIILEKPRTGARIPVVSAGGKIYRVPVEMLKHEPEYTLINDEKARELVTRGLTHLETKRERARQSRERSAELDRRLADLLGFKFW